MSEYLRVLDPTARARYIEKLQLVGLSENEDPYELWKCGRFEDDMTKVATNRVWTHFLLFR